MSRTISQTLLFLGALSLSANAQTARQLFTHATADIAHSIGDIDGDMRTDYAIASSADPTSTISIFSAATVLGTGAPILTLTPDVNSFSCFPTRAFGRGLAVGDVDQDGMTDFIVGSPETSQFPCTPQTTNTGRVELYLGSNLAVAAWTVDNFAASTEFGSRVELVADGNHPGGARILASGAGFTLLMDASTGFVLANHPMPLGSPMTSAGDFDGDGLLEYALPSQSDNAKIELFDAATGSLEQTITAPSVVGSAPLTGLALNSSAGAFGSRLAASWSSAQGGRGVIVTFDLFGVTSQHIGEVGEGVGRVLSGGEDVNVPSSGSSVNDLVALLELTAPGGEDARITLDATNEFQGQSIVLPAGQFAVDAELIGTVDTDVHAEILVTTSAGTTILFSGGAQAETIELPACPAGGGFNLKAPADAIPGTTVTLAVTGAQPMVPASMFFGPPSAPGAPGLPTGLPCNLMFTNLADVISFPLPPTNAAGETSLPLAFTIGLLGQLVGFQAATLTPAGVDLSNGLSMVIGW